MLNIEPIYVSYSKRVIKSFGRDLVVAAFLATIIIVYCLVQHSFTMRGLRIGSIVFVALVVLSSISTMFSERHMLKSITINPSTKKVHVIINKYDSVKIDKELDFASCIMKIASSTTRNTVSYKLKIFENKKRILKQEDNGIWNKSLFSIIVKYYANLNNVYFDPKYDFEFDVPEKYFPDKEHFSVQ